MSKTWNIRSYNEKLVEEYTNRLNISKILAKLLIARNIGIEKAENFTKLTLAGLYDPFLMKGMQEIVNRILKARENNETVTIYGDYDVDGVTSITVLYSFLKELGMHVEYYLPDRMEEGYGLNKDALLKIKSQGTSLVITVDCGISAISEVKYAKSIGLDICVTDHHECGSVLPEATTIVNPKQEGCKYPFKSLAGVGVTFKVVTAVCEELGLADDVYLKYLDIVAIGTIADIVALVDENRVITKFGIDAIRDSFYKTNPREGLKAIIRVAGIKSIDSTNISFGIAPRINASGRMADASVAVKMLLAKTEVEANEYAKVLDIQNKERQAVERQILKEVIQRVEDERLYEKKAIVVDGKNWHQGVIGIVASKVAEKYLKPVILLTYEDDVAKGSGRTPPGLSLYDALEICKDVLIQFGGHELAAGVTLKVENIELFKQSFENAVSKLQKHEFESIIYIDLEITAEDILTGLTNEISKMLPFGQKNPEPVIIYRGIKIDQISTLKDEKHIKFVLKDGSFTIDAIGFGQGKRRDELKLGDVVDVVGTIGVNEFSKDKSVQIILKDFKKVV